MIGGGAYVGIGIVSCVICRGCDVRGGIDGGCCMVLVLAMVLATEH